MPQVPYQPFTTATPSTGGAERVSVATPPAAFGENIAQAVQHLGGTIEQVGGELFDRASQLQSLHNETNARNAGVGMTLETAKEENDFAVASRQGAVGPEALQAHTARLAAIRDKWRTGLDNDEARKMYDADSWRVFTGTVMRSGSLAAAATEANALSAINAKHATQMNDANLRPNDEEAFQQTRRDLASTRRRRAELTTGGYSPEKEAFYEQDDDSKLHAERVIGWARDGQIDKANEMLQQYKSQGLIAGKELDTATKQVQALTRTVGADQIANKVLEKYYDPTTDSYKATSEQMQQETRDNAQKAFPGDSEMPLHAAGAFDRQLNQRNFAATQDHRQAAQEEYTAIQNRVMTVDGLSESTRRKMTPQQIAEYPTHAFRYWEEKAREGSYTIYRDMLGKLNDNPTEFFNTNINSIPGLRQEERDKLIEKQRKGTAMEDPRVQRAITMIKNGNEKLMRRLKLWNPNDRPTEHAQFTGAIHDALQVWQEAHPGRQPNDKEVNEDIFKGGILKEMKEPGRFWGENTVPLYKQQVPEAYRAAQPNVPTDELTREYHAAEFERLFGKPVKPNQGRVESPK